jgi:hypothetical protein
MVNNNYNLEGTQGEESNNKIRLGDRLEKIFIPANSLYNLEYKEGKISSREANPKGFINWISRGK